ncbi:ankyrin repeat-containing domain protein [Cercophora samala]|uniref:Ankyrin repeat-containing domain protein n=1 Tax=Cercophora samala TaxID=330535 RepID=A0AA40D3G9_9PEZI|nr:ankyrin repeat-containing domain protein [Cercophora samala]
MDPTADVDAPGASAATSNAHRPLSESSEEAIPQSPQNSTPGAVTDENQSQPPSTHDPPLSSTLESIGSDLGLLHNTIETDPAERVEDATGSIISWGEQESGDDETNSTTTSSNPLRYIGDPFEASKDEAPTSPKEILNRRFWYACRNGKLKKVKRLLKQGANVYVERRAYVLKRQYSDEGSDSDSDEDDDGADSDAETLRNNPAGFWVACRAGDMEEAQRQLWYYKMKRRHRELWQKHIPDDSDWDSDRDQEDRDRQRKTNNRYQDLGTVSALYIAIKQKHYDIALHILEQDHIGHLGKLYTVEKETVLHKAVAKEATDVYEKLIQHKRAGKLGKTKNGDGDTAIQTAVMFGDVNATRVLLSSKNGNPHSLESLLHLVASHRRSRPPKNVDVARLLLMNGAQVDWEDATVGKTTALQAACKRKDVGMIKLLLAWKAQTGRDDALRLAGDELWENKDETKPAWSSAVPKLPLISTHFNVGITMSYSCDLEEGDSYTRNWTQFMSMDDFLR